MEGFIVSNNKTGKYYAILHNAIDCTNERDGLDVVVYKDTNHQIFVREKEEFWQKFTKII